MTTNVIERRRAFAAALERAGIDLEKDFFELDSFELSKLDNIRRFFGYSGRNYLGRSRCRQFYYAAQMAK